MTRVESESFAMMLESSPTPPKLESASTKFRVPNKQINIVFGFFNPS